MLRLLLAAALLLGAAPAWAQGADGDLIARGRYLAVAADCTACHTDPVGGKPFAGGYAINSPLGAIYASNITPSKTHGIGNYTEAQFARAVREGVRADGAHLYPAMPYTSYVKLSDADISALYAYFMQDVQPVDVGAAQTHLPFPFDLRISMAVWNALFLDDHRFQPDPAKSPQWNRGAYLAEALEHCSTCHTPRNLLMAEQPSRAYAGAAVGPWYAPNITSDPVSGVGGWSREELVGYLKSGAVHAKNQAAGGMAEAVSHSLQYLRDDDLQALAAYVQSLRPIRDNNQTKPAYAWGGPAHDEAALRGTPPSGQLEGARLYSRYCASCHEPSGAGTLDHAFPSLFHNTATGGLRADNLVAAILYGVERQARGRDVLMPSFDDRSYVQPLTTAQVVTISNYVLKTFGDPSVQVTAADLDNALKGGAPTPLLQAAAALPIAGIVVLLLLILGGFLLLRRRRRLRS